VFICDECHQVTQPGESANKIIVESREKVYEKKTKDKNGFVRVKYSKGIEIVKEIKVCHRCKDRRVQ